MSFWMAVDGVRWRMGSQVIGDSDAQIIQFL
jgi:hypothetical protein